MIEVRNLTKKYGNTKVVDNVSLDIEKGKMISLLDQMVQEKVQYYQ